MNISLTAAIDRVNEMVNGLIAALPGLVIGTIVFTMFYIMAGWVRQLVERLMQRSQLEHTATRLFGQLSRWGVIFFGVLVALSVVIPSFEPGQLIELLGIGSIAVGFAFRDIAQNFLAGLLILITRPFRIGDQIITGDFEGTIEEIETRATVIKTYDGRRVVIPNANLFTDSVTVNTAFDRRRSEYDVGISYYDDIDQARAVMLDVLAATEGVLETPAPDVLTVALDSSSVNLRARW